MNKKKTKNECDLKMMIMQLQKLISNNKNYDIHIKSEILQKIFKNKAVMYNCTIKNIKGKDNMNTIKKDLYFIDSVIGENSKIRINCKKLSYNNGKNIFVPGDKFSITEHKKHQKKT